MSSLEESELKKLLLEEIENKKVFQAMNDVDCDACGNLISEDEDFIFMGSKKKVCNECQEKLTVMLEE